MYKNLAPHTLGLFGSQNELIELALTHRFKGIQVVYDDFRQQVESKGIDQASRLLKSAPFKITSTEIPFEWWGEDAEFERQMAGLAGLIQPIKQLGCLAVTTNVLPGCTQRPYHENFEMHRVRLAAIAEALAAHDIRFGVGFEIPFGIEYPYSFISEPEALVTLLKLCAADNLGLVVDAWRWTVAGGSFDLLAGLQANQIVDIRLADLSADWNPNRLTEDDRLVYGSTGVVKGWELHAQLSAIEYRGPVTPYASPGQYSDMRSENAIKQAAELVDTFVAGTAPPDSAEVASAESA